MHHSCFDIATHSSADWRVNGDDVDEDVRSISTKSGHRMKLLGGGTHARTARTRSLPPISSADIQDGNETYNAPLSPTSRSDVFVARHGSSMERGWQPMHGPQSNNLIGSVAKLAPSCQMHAAVRSHNICVEIRPIGHEISPKRMETFVADVSQPTTSIATSDSRRTPGGSRGGRDSCGGFRRQMASSGQCESVEIGTGICHTPETSDPCIGE